MMQEIVYKHNIRDLMHMYCYFWANKWCW